MHRLFLVCLLAVGLFSACSLNYDYKGTQFTCSGTECPEGFTCINGRCLEGGGCTTDAECAANQVCNNGSCQLKDPKTSCTTDADCGIAGYCIASKCSQGGQGERCTATVQCQSGHVCQELNGTTVCLRQCASHTDCQLQETCRPSLTGGDSVCVPRCDVVAQQGCQRTESCVLTKTRGYCRAKSGSKTAGLTCSQDADCELHLYCRPVKGYPTIKRCTNVCDTQQLTGCKTGQQCILLSPEETPYGFCEPQPTVVEDGDICGGDLICKTGSKCGPLPGSPNLRCQSSAP